MRLLDSYVGSNIVPSDASIYPINKSLTCLSFPFSLKLMTAVSIGTFLGRLQVATYIGVNNDDMHFL
jgi:hypothetical protein